MLLIASAVCGARQTPPAVVPAQQAGVASEIDALAGKLMQKMISDKVTSVVVVGGAGPDTKVSNFGVDLRDELNSALAKQSTGIHVFSTEELRTVVRQNRVMGGMIYSNAMMYWIASRAHADALVGIQIDSLKDGRALVTAQLSEGPDLHSVDKHSKANVPDVKTRVQVALTSEQIESASQEYHAAASIPVAEAGKNGVSFPACVYCPRPDYSDRARAARFQGKITLRVVVLPDGTADDVMILIPLGHGLDSLAIDAVLKWKFKAAVDSQNRPVATQINIEIAFQLYK